MQFNEQVRFSHNISHKFLHNSLIDLVNSNAIMNGYFDCFEFLGFTSHCKVCCFLNASSSKWGHSIGQGITYWNRQKTQRGTDHFLFAHNRWYRSSFVSETQNQFCSKLEWYLKQRLTILFLFQWFINNQWIATEDNLLFRLGFRRH